MMKIIGHHLDRGALPDLSNVLENSDRRDAQNSDNNNMSFIKMEENLNYNMITLNSLQHI
jgi:hypothetical protein